MRGNWMTTIALVSAIIALPAVASAQITEAQKGAGVGVLLGAGTGAIVGAAVHHPIAGTVEVKSDAINNQDRQMLLSQQRQLQQQRREIEQLQQMQSTE